jgi:hypothetical protein
LVLNTTVHALKHSSIFVIQFFGLLQVELRRHHAINASEKKFGHGFDFFKDGRTVILSEAQV